MGTIANGANRPLNQQTGTVPDVSGAIRDWFQPMQFDRVTKTTVGFQVSETMVPVNFRGVLQPFTPRQLAQKSEGQRAWTWLLLFSDPVLTLNVDEVVMFRGKQTRVMSRKNFELYGYVEYTLVQDWTGSGPSVASTRTGIDGGNSAASGANIIDGGNSAASGDNVIDGGSPAGS